VPEPWQNASAALVVGIRGLGGGGGGAQGGGGPPAPAPLLGSFFFFFFQVARGKVGVITHGGYPVVLVSAFTTR